MDEHRELNIWNWMAGFRGDRTILIITLVLLIASVITVFSSTSLLALGTGTTREAIMGSHLMYVGIGALVIAVIYFIGNRSLYRFIGKYSFLLSLGMLLILVTNLDLGFIRAGSINGAARVIVVFGLQLHVYEFVKLLMVLYVSWALEAYKEDGFRISKRIAGLHPRLSFLASPMGEKCIYLYIPLAATIGIVQLGSNSAALFIAGILVLLFFIGGISLRDIGMLGAAMAIVVGLLIAANAIGLIQTNRYDTGLNRVRNDEKAQMDSLLHYRPGGGHYDSARFQLYRDKLRQPVGAQLAIRDGGLFGKGIGNSSQKYVVPVIFSDYMFSFIIEETGLIGAAIIIFLYYTILARGVAIAGLCKDYFDKVVVTGCSILFTGQAFMHMLVNIHFPLVPQTGQTLPLMSHGTSSLMVFCVVLGILLSLSKRENLNEDAPPEDRTTDGTD